MTVRGTIALVSLLAVFGCDKASKIATGSLSGTAKYAGKTDHSGISVSAGGFSTVTDATGASSFAALAAGAYSVTAVAPASTERTVARASAPPGRLSSMAGRRRAGVLAGSTVSCRRSTRRRCRTFTL